MKSTLPSIVRIGRFLGASAFFAALGLGCGASADTPTTAPAATQKAEADKPFLFGEAKLPAGFPPPSAVDEVVIKEYPAYRLARVSSAAMGQNAKGRANPDGMFMPLFRHIQRNKIAMTAPVEMEYGAKADDGVPVAESMAFLYGEPTIGSVGKDAGDPRVEVVDMPAMTVISVAVRGEYNARNFQKALTKLEDWIEANPGNVRVVGAARYLAYNSPFVPGVMRYGEVQWPVERVKTAPK